MQVSNVKYYPNYNWDDYTKLPGLSFSFLKNDGASIEETPGMRLGKLVHTYLLKPKEYNWENAEMVIPIAKVLMRYNLTTAMVPECGITADFEHEGLIMHWRGMPDLHRVGALVSDFKILAGDLSGYLKRLLYEEQLRGYGLPIRAPLGLIIGFNKKSQRVQTHVVKPDPRWWIYKIKQYGKPQPICQP